jgi:surface polysaccharide O-acyltransferase-like enzyme
MVKQRESNIELLRVIAIFLVLIIHAIMLPSGIGISDIHINVIPAIVKCFFVSISIICVNVFVIISGWYGIHASLRGVCKLMFQCLFLGMIGYAFSIYFGYLHFGVGNFIKSFVDCIDPGWFISAYMIMYIFSPIMNSAVEYTSEKQLRYVLVALFTFEFVYGWLFPEASSNGSTFKSGYSSLSLMMLYLLARYMRVYLFDGKMLYKHYKVLKGGAQFWFFVWIGIVFVDTIVWAITSYFGIGQIDSRIFTYTNPLVIVQSVAIFMFFKNINLYSKLINWLGASSLAVLIVHCYMNAEPFLFGVKNIYNDFNGIICLLILFCYMAVIYMSAILLDKVRILFWNKFYKYIPEIRI